MYKLLLFLLIFQDINGMVQYIDVSGRILCEGKPLSHIKVKLYEEDVFSSTLLDEMYTDENGYFLLKGNDDEYSRIEPYISFTYTCPTHYRSSTHDTKIFYVSSDLFEIYKLYNSYYYNYGEIELSKILKKIN